MTDEANKAREAEHTLEIYKLAFERLTFQDEYLFKFSTVFLTAHGALALLCRSPFSSTTLSYELLAGVSTVGFALAVIWCIWVGHNDHWHSVWTGVLKDIEPMLYTDAKFWTAPHGDIAVRGGRSRQVMRGHGIALLIPLVIATAWFLSALIAWSHVPTMAQQSHAADPPASASLRQAGG